MRDLFRFVTVTFALGIGYITGYTRILPGIPEQNLLTSYYARTIGDLHRGLSTLANCAYLHKTYPLTWVKLIHNTTHIPQKDLTFAYDPYNPYLQDSYAATKGHTITLMDAYFAEPDTMRESIIAHEYLHYLGFPNHKWSLSGKINYEKDPTYSTITKCFGEGY